jgi:DNA-binding NarL/FixJ family response regulator
LGAVLGSNGVYRIVLAEDDEDYTAALATVIESDPRFEVAAVARNGAECLEVVETEDPDAVVMDIEMPDVDGIEATRAILAANAEIQVVVLTSLAERERILAALDAGAVGYLLKDSEPEQLIGGIRSAARGESPLDPKAARAVLTARAAHERVELSEREREVLRCVAEGLPNKLIARQLGISEKTVKAHLTRVFQQIGVTDRTQAALWARDNLA